MCGVFIQTRLFNQHNEFQRNSATEQPRAARRRWRGLEPGRDFDSFPVPPLISLHSAASGAADAERSAA
jgi:hypothetical protein